MHKIILAVGILAFGTGVQAGEQVLRVTPQSLNDWTVNGADKSAVGQSTILTLPAGSQLSRSFDRDRVAVQLNTPLVFGFAGEDFPTVEVDRVALVFSREGSEGQVVLVMGEARSTPLPFQVKLNADGSSVGPVDVQLAYERGTGSVVVTGFGQTLRYATETSTQPVEVVISAGAHDAMTLQALAVRLTVPEDAADERGGRDGSSQPESKDDNALARAAGKNPSNLSWPPGGGESVASGETKDEKSNGLGSSSTLEIFTPSAVRHGRVDAVRATAVSARKSTKEAQP